MDVPHPAALESSVLALSANYTPAQGEHTRQKLEDRQVAWRVAVTARAIGGVAAEWELGRGWGWGPSVTPCGPYAVHRLPGGKT